MPMPNIDKSSTEEIEWAIAIALIVLAIVVLLAIVAVIIGPYIVHIVWCIQMAHVTGSAIALLIVGIVVAPVGWIHGACIILGIGGWIG